MGAGRLQPYVRTIDVCTRTRFFGLCCEEAIDRQKHARDCSFLFFSCVLACLAVLASRVSGGGWFEPLLGFDFATPLSSLLLLLLLLMVMVLLVLLQVSCGRIAASGKANEELLPPVFPVLQGVLR